MAKKNSSSSSNSSNTASTEEATAAAAAPLDLGDDGGNGVAEAAEAPAAEPAATEPATEPAAAAAAEPAAPTIVGPGTQLKAPAREESELEAGLRLARARVAEIKPLLAVYALANKKGAESQAKVNELKDRRRAAIRDLDAQVLAAERAHDKLWNGPGPDGLAWQVVEHENLERELAELQRVIG